MRLQAICVLFLVASASPAQEAPTPLERRLYRGEAPTTEQLAALRPLDRAWVQVHALAPAERCDAYLDLAEKHEELSARALLAASHALRIAYENHAEALLARAVPDAAERENLTPNERRDRALARPIGRLEQLLARMRELEVDPRARQEALETLDSLRCGSRHSMRNVPPGGTFHVPAPRPRPLRLTITPVDAAAPGAAIVHEIPSGANPLDLPVPPPGIWTLELSERGGPWRSEREVRVTGLTFDAIDDGRTLLVGARLGDERVADAQIRLSAQGLLLAEGATGPAGLARLQLPRALIQSMRTGFLLLEVVSGAHRASTWLRTGAQPLHVKEALQAHGFCERPLYRRGERARGRIVARFIESENGCARSNRITNRNASLILWEDTKHETRVIGRFDEHGVFAFSCEVPPRAPHRFVSARLRVGNRSARLRRLFRVDPFRRAPILASLEAPRRIDGSRAQQAVLEAHWSHGAPASHAPTRVFVESGGLSQALKTTLDANGRLTVQLPDDEAFHAERGRLVLSAEILAPDGQSRRIERTLRIGAATPDNARPEVLQIRAGDRVVRPGRERNIEFRGTPGSYALALFQSPGFSTHTMLRFDRTGRAAWPVRVPDDESGEAFIDVTSNGDRTRAKLRIQRPQDELAIQLATDRRSFLPGEKCQLRLRVVDASRAPAPAVVSLAVVDERILAIQDVDDASGLDSALALDWNSCVARAGFAASPAPWRLLGEMMRDGRPGEAWSPRFGSSGGPGAAVSTLRALGIPEKLLRKDFRPSVGFAAGLKTDAEGYVTHEFTFPDDLTTWRLRAVAIGEGFGHRAARFALVTEKKLSVETALPRHLYLGDRVRTVPIVSSKSGKSPQWAAETSPELALRTSESMSAGIELHARSRGNARLRLAVRSGELADAMERRIPVARDTVREALSARATADLRWQRIEIPKANELEQVVIGVGRQALLQDLRKRLEKYPYRCAEQTSSRLLGLFGRRSSGDAKRRMDRDAMVDRLRRLWRPTSAAFAWWPGEASDPGISAFVLHTLSELRDVGLDRRHFGFQLGESRLMRKNLAQRLALSGEAPSTSQIADAEHAIGLLRYFGKQSGLDHSLREFLRKSAQLPKGLLARAGLAFVANGEKEFGLQLLERLRQEKPRSAPGLDLGEGDGVAETFELRLCQELGLQGAATTRLEESLVVSLERRGFVHTWRAACFLQALSRTESSNELPEVTKVELRIDGKLHRLQLDAENGHRTSLLLSGLPRVEARSPDGGEVRVRLLGARQVPAQGYRARSSGLRIRRELVDTPAGTVHHQSLCRLRIEVVSETDTSYLVVRCPLPPGCELQERQPGVERDGHDIVYSIPRVMAGKPHVREIRVAFGFEGDFLWPPVHVEDMYGGHFFAYGDGGRIRVLPAPPRNETAGESLRVFPLEYRWRCVERAFEEALATDEPEAGPAPSDSPAERRLDAAEDLLDDARIRLDQAAVTRWWPRLSARFGSRAFFLVRYLEPQLDGQFRARHERLDATSDLLSWVHFVRTCANERRMRERFLHAGEAAFATLLGEVAWKIDSDVRSSFAASFEVRGFRHHAGAIRPELSRHLDCLTHLVQRAEELADRIPTEGFEGLAYALDQEDLGHSKRGAAPSPAERRVLARLAALHARVMAVLETRREPDSNAEDRPALAWSQKGPKDWPECCEYLETVDVERVLRHGSPGREYLLAQANLEVPIENESHWLAHMAAGERVDLAVLTCLVYGYEDVERLQPWFARVPETQLVATFRDRKDPELRLTLLLELARRGAENPVSPADPTGRYYTLAFRAARGDAFSQRELKKALCDEELPGEYLDHAWRALLLGGVAEVDFALEYADRFTKREYEALFAKLRPSGRRRLFEVLGREALPARLSAEQLRELRTTLWATILEDPADNADLLDHFVVHAEAHAFVRSQLRASHSENAHVADYLLSVHGLSFLYCDRSGEERKLQDPSAPGRLADAWLRGAVELPPALQPRGVARRMLRHRGCSLR